MTRFAILYLVNSNVLSSDTGWVSFFLGSLYLRQSLAFFLVGDIVVLKSIIRPTKIVTIGVLKSTDPSKEVEGEELEPDYWKVHVQVPIKPNESLIRSYGLVKTIVQAIGANVAWLAPFVISQVIDVSQEYLYK
ncbi:hypothetical protein ACSBR1_037305 [Camellia fascicularis]